MKQHEPIQLGSIKAKKNKVVNMEESNGYVTPLKRSGQQSKIYMLTTISARNKVGQDLRETATELKAGNNQPTNPFYKQIFVRNREIKTVPQLHEYYKQSKIVSKSNYIYKPCQSLNQSVSSVSSPSSEKHKKGPKNILAAESALWGQPEWSIRSVEVGRPKCNMASSIKQKIMRKEEED